MIEEKVREYYFADPEAEEAEEPVVTEEGTESEEQNLDEVL